MTETYQVNRTENGNEMGNSLETTATEAPMVKRVSNRTEYRDFNELPDEADRKKCLMYETYAAD
jgi:hypothetical protein